MAACYAGLGAEGPRATCYTDGVWPKGFDPASLTRDASLNKLVVGAAPGAQPAHLGLRGGDLLGRDTVVSLVRQRCGADVDPGAVTDWLVAAVAAEPAGAAVAVVDEVGDRLASLIATLRDPATGMAATGGRRSYLEVWQSLDLVMLGGGLMKGVVGERVAARAAAALARWSDNPPAVRVAPHPECLALLGAARSASGGQARVVVLDGGQTSIKRGIASFRGGDLVGVDVLEPLPLASVPGSELSAAVVSAVTALRERHPDTAPEAIVSVASYVHDGRPIHDHASVYEQLDPASMRSSLGVPVRLVHDGSAAWRGTGSGARSAVIMLGTWLGVGIGPHRQPLRRYSPHFEVRLDGPDA